MRLSDIPCFSNLFLDFVGDAPAVRPFLPRRSDFESVKSFAREVQKRQRPREKVLEILESNVSDFMYGDTAKSKLRRLAAPDTIIILTSFRGDFTGASFSQFLKCITAAKLAAKLESAGIPAVSVCWLSPALKNDPLAPSSNLLSRSACLQTLPAGQAGEGAPAELEQIREEIELALGASVNAEAMELLRQYYASGADLRMATGRLLSNTLADLGIVIAWGQNHKLLDLSCGAMGLTRLDPEECSTMVDRQRSILRESGYEWPGIGDQREGDLSEFAAPFLLQSVLPVVASIVDQTDAYHHALLSPLISRLNLSAPRLWPCASLTIIDTRSRKILEKYGLGLVDLFGGGDGVLRRLANDGETENAERRLEQLELRIDTDLSQLEMSIPLGEGLRGAIEDSRARMTYQVRKLKDRFHNASQLRREVMSRQVERACDSLAPEGCLQEFKRPGIHFILLYSPAMIRNLFEKLDVLTLEHQLISLE